LQEKPFDGRKLKFSIGKIVKDQLQDHLYS
jgi:hypothetical protein